MLYRLKCNSFVLCAYPNCWHIYSSIIRTLYFVKQQRSPFKSTAIAAVLPGLWLGGSSLCEPIFLTCELVIITVSIFWCLLGRLNKLINVKPSEQGLAEGSCQHMSTVFLNYADVVDTIWHLWGPSKIHNLYLITSKRITSSIAANVHCLSNILRSLTASYMEINISIKTKLYIKQESVFENKCKTNS